MSLRRNPPPVESIQARTAIITAYNTLSVLHLAGHLAVLAELGDPMAAKQVAEAIAEIETLMSPNLLCTILPAYTKVAFSTKQSDREIEGLIREGAYGLQPDQDGSTKRRITTTGAHGGWEMFVDTDTEFTYFEILERVK